MNELMTQDASSMALMKREESEIQSAIISAKKFPRDEEQSVSKLFDSMKRQSMALKSTYSFPRGGSTVSGPSIGMAREAARCWGNIRHGIRVISVDDRLVHIKGVALDVETNTNVECEDKFEKLIYRGKKWVVPDERDLRELINRRGAILVRNSILQLIPADVIEEALLIAKKAAIGQAKQDIKKDKKGTLTKLIETFAGINVTPEDLSAYLKEDINKITPEQITELRAIFVTIRDGNAKVAEYFKNKQATDSNKLNDIFEDVPE